MPRLELAILRYTHTELISFLRRTAKWELTHLCTYLGPETFTDWKYFTSMPKDDVNYQCQELSEIF